MVPKNEKQNNMARVQYTYTIAYVYHSMSFVMHGAQQECKRLLLNILVPSISKSGRTAIV